MCFRSWAKSVSLLKSQTEHILSEMHSYGAETEQIFGTGVMKADC